MRHLRKRHYAIKADGSKHYLPTLPALATADNMVKAIGQLKASLASSITQDTQLLVSPEVAGAMGLVQGTDGAWYCIATEVQHVRPLPGPQRHVQHFTTTTVQVQPERRTVALLRRLVVPLGIALGCAAMGCTALLLAHGYLLLGELLVR